MFSSRNIKADFTAHLSMAVDKKDEEIGKPNLERTAITG